MLYAFVVGSMVWGYYEYKSIWENLLRTMSSFVSMKLGGNPHDTYAVAVKGLIAGERCTVGHISRKIFFCSIFIRPSDAIYYTVSGYRRYLMF